MGAVNGDKKSDKVGVPLAEVVHGCGLVVVGVGHQPGGHLCTRPLGTLCLQVTVKLEWGLMGRSLQRESERLLLDVAAGSLEICSLCYDGFFRSNTCWCDKLTCNDHISGPDDATTRCNWFHMLDQTHILRNCYQMVVSQRQNTLTLTQTQLI